MALHLPHLLKADHQQQAPHQHHMQKQGLGLRLGRAAVTSPAGHSPAARIYSKGPHRLRMRSLSLRCANINIW